MVENESQLSIGTFRMCDSPACTRKAVVRATITSDRVLVFCEKHGRAMEYYYLVEDFEHVPLVERLDEHES